MNNSHQRHELSGTLRNLKAEAQAIAQAMRDAEAMMLVLGHGGRMTLSDAVLCVQTTHTARQAAEQLHIDLAKIDALWMHKRGHREP